MQAKGASRQTEASWTERIVAALALLATCACLFLYVDQLNARSAASGAATTRLETSLDAHVPFVPEFVFAYLLYYPWLLLLLPIVARRRDFYRAVATLCVVELIALGAFVAFPSHMDRPQVYGDGLAATLVRWVYHVDAGWNLAPSLHVAHVTLVALFYKELRPRALPWVIAGGGAIALSTVLIKQHYVIDIPFGVLCALMGYCLTNRGWLRARFFLKTLPSS